MISLERPASMNGYPELSRHEHMPVCDFEPVLMVPPRQVPEVWKMLSDARCVVQFWQIGGRFGGRIRDVEGDARRGIPLPPTTSLNILEPNACSQTLREPCQFIFDAIQAGLMEIRYLQPVPSKRVPRVEKRGDGTVHPERKRGPVLLHRNQLRIAFTFVELFAGVGGFRQGLEPLGGKCVFSSEIDINCVDSYERNYKATPAGDICKVSSSSIPDHDLLVGGFPCQPFSREGLQPGFDCKSGDGLLFEQIVRILNDKYPKAFFLENVPGLLSCDEGRTFEVICNSLTLNGRYKVTAELINARCLTAQYRKRLFIVGIRAGTGGSPPFRFPYVPDLGLRFVDVQETDEAINTDNATAEDYTLSDSQFEKLQQSKLWCDQGPNGRMAWEGKQCETLISNYGQCIANGSSMVVPRRWPHNPRRFTARECARLMGFPDSFDLGKVKAPNHAIGELEKASDYYPPANVWFKSHYRMLGNAVCPPLICAIGGALIQQCPEIEKDGDTNWEGVGVSTAILLALRAVEPNRRQAVLLTLLDTDLCVLDGF